MAEAEEIQHLTNSLAIWSSYDSSVKAELFSSAIRTANGTYLVDPIPLKAAVLKTLIDDSPIVGIISTNANHSRAGQKFSVEFQAPILEAAGDRKLDATLSAISIPGAAENEIALFCEDDGGTVIMGDALINFGSHGFDFLPKKYCADQKLMKRSLRKLLAFKFSRILFAHGQPILSRAHLRLEELLDREPL